MSVVLTNLRESLAQGQVTDHLRALDDALTTEGVVIGTMPSKARRRESVSVAARREAAPEASYYAATEQRVGDRMRALHSQRLEKEQERLRQIQRNTEKASGEIHTYFRNVENELASRVKSRALEVFHSYGSTILQPPSATVLDPEKVSWDRLNQQVEIRILSIRGVRDKVPAGRYILLVSKLTQLGGANMPWSTKNARSTYPPQCQLHDVSEPYRTRAKCEVCSGKIGSTVPIDFLGTHAAHSMQFDSTLYTFMPPETSIKPYQVLLFELVRLQDGKKPSTVAWGCFPTVNSTFSIVRGKFRVPMLRGCVRDDFRHYTSMQQWIQNDIENWFANLYFEVFPKDREYFGRKEFDLQSKAYSKLLGLEGQDEGQWEDDVEEATTSKWKLVRKKMIAKAASEEEETKKAIVWTEYSGNVNGTKAGEVQRSWYVQLQYCWRAVLDELSIQHPQRAKFWLVLGIFFITLYVQLFLHGIGVRIALGILDVPIIDEFPTYYGFIVEYRVFFTTAFQEIFIVLFSMMVNLLVTALLIASSVLFKYATGTFPEQFSKFIFTSGITMLLVPFIQVIISSSLGLHYDDITRLRDFCEFHKYAEFLAIGGFLVMYGNTSAVLLVLLYVYTMRIHLNGILQDSYWRINLARDDDTLFTPGDFELSTNELTWILEKAEGWRGATGKRRKVVVEQLVTTDEIDSQYNKKELRIAIYELDCGVTESQIRLWLEYKPSKLFREFYVLENGTIIEALHDDKSPGLSTSWAIAQWKKKMNNIFGLKREATVSFL